MDVLTVDKRKKRCHILCEKTVFHEHLQTPGLINGTTYWPRDTQYVACPLGHYTHYFLACDFKSSCWQSDPSSYCGVDLPSHPVFTCINQVEHVPYDLVCDHRADCVDRSDEDFCSYPSCRAGYFLCGNRQCIPPLKVCDGWEDCYEGEEEKQCSEEVGGDHIISISPPALVTLSQRGRLVLSALNAPRSIEPCPDTHFQCLDNGYCLPMFLRCNDVNDCPGHEDETGCDACPGFYRCRGSKVCLVYSDLCDGHGHCPQHDDEMMCGLICPPSCLCRGLVFYCGRSFPASTFPRLRYLDASGSATTPEHLTGNGLLIHLSLSNCRLTHLDNLTFPNLISLDVQNNYLSIIRYPHLVGVPQLRQLSVGGNPLRYVFNGAGGTSSFPNLQKLDLSRVVILDFRVTVLSAFPNLRVLNLSNSWVQRIEGEFRDFKLLRVLDLRGCPMKWFPRGMLDGLKNLQTVYAHTFKMCCPAVLPADFKLHDCFAPSDAISSCENLLRENACKIGVFVLSLFAVLGNSVSFIFRTCLTNTEKTACGNLVTHLSVSDFLMGVYLVIIGITDQVYNNTYLWNDTAWKHSAVCKFAAFLFLLSNEVSALIVCLITVDRFLALLFSFSRFHFSPLSAHASSAVVWIGGVVLALVPVLPVTSGWEFHSQTGICFPLAVARKEFGGRNYYFGVLVVFNLVVFAVISVGQMTISWCVLNVSMTVSGSARKTRKDLSLARRLISVAMADALCWLPAGVLGLLSFHEVSIPNDVSVTAAVIVLPLKSAVNPCLYAANVTLERRARAREEKLRNALLAQLKGGN